MALTKATSSVSDVGQRVAWPEFPALDSLKPEEEKQLRDWYYNVRGSVDRTLAVLTQAIEKKANA